MQGFDFVFIWRKKGEVPDIHKKLKTVILAYGRALW
jgi:hypothetical protein